MNVKRIKMKKNISLASFTTFRVGGPAEFIAEPKNIDEIIYLTTWAHQKNINCNLIGAGSNLLINDTGVKGLSICTKQLRGARIDCSTGIIEAFSGEPLPTLARRAAKSGLHGLEWAVGIPGTIGGAIVMNAGAQGKSISELVETIKVLSLNEGKTFELTKNALNFSYRHSLLQKEKLIVLSARLKLEPGHEATQLTQITNNNLNRRITTQPYRYLSCGSIFRNPEPLKAGKLIESLGLKGEKIGGAEISTIHANFIVNTNNAKATDIKKLILFIQSKVKEAYGVCLHPEVQTFGF